MTMHGTFWRFPKSFSAFNTSGIAPRSTYLKVIGDFCRWNDHIVFGCDDAAKSVFQNTRKIKNDAAAPGQSQSNLWFVNPGKLDHLGTPLGRGAVWLNDDLQAGSVSEPYLFNGYSKRMIHLTHQSGKNVTFTLEIDRTGSGDWQTLKTLEVPPLGYRGHVFDEDLKAQWIRIETGSSVQSATAYFHYSGGEQPNTEPAAIFDGLAHHTDCKNRSAAILWALGNNQRKPGIAAKKQTGDQVEQMEYYELDGKLQLRNRDNPKMLDRVRQAAPMKHNIRIDEASVIVEGENIKQSYRLPKATAGYSIDETVEWPRIAREIVTERDLMNCAGTFYELPSRMAGGMARIRPISTHNLQIYDFASYRGLLVMSGVSSDADHSGNPHIITSEDGQVALWAGAIDDLWKLGKPRGVGGPWKNSRVKAGVASHPYLMTGYDKKMVRLEHDAGQTVTFNVEVDFTGKGLWKTYETFEVEPGEPLKHRFPEGFSAYWVRLRANSDCKATAWFIYE